MIKLKNIEDPFSPKYLTSFDSFRNEKKFYDCINHNILADYDTFGNLQYSFYTYLLTSEKGEWLGYVLFHNKDLVDGYIKELNTEAIKIIDKLSELNDISILNKVVALRKEISNKLYDSTNNLSVLDSKIHELEDICIVNYPNLKEYFTEYNNNNANYLLDFLEYYYLDVVIALPQNSNDKTIEYVYYGFIRETYQLIDNFIQDKFKTVPLVLKDSSYTLCLVDNIRANYNVDVVEKNKIKRYSGSTFI